MVLRAGGWGGGREGGVCCWRAEESAERLLKTFCLKLFPPARPEQRPALSDRRALLCSAPLPAFTLISRQLLKRSIQATLQARAERGALSFFFGTGEGCFVSLFAFVSSRKSPFAAQMRSSL